MHNIELIIFDLDGTLVDSSQDIVNAINFMLKGLGLAEKTNQEIISYVGNGVAELIRRSLKEKNIELQDRGFSLFKDYYRAHPVDNTYLYPGVTEVLGHFGDKQKALVTNRNLNSSLVILRKMAIDSYFANVIGDDNISCLKPSRCQFDRLLDKVLIKDKKKIIMVGDMDIDILGGKASGVVTCAATYGFGKREDLEKAEPDYMIDNIAELKSIIN